MPAGFRRSACRRGASQNRGAIRDVSFELDERVFLMFGSANRDEKHFERADQFDVRRDTSKSVAFGAGPHFCAGAWASRAMIADVALPTVFARAESSRTCRP